MFHLEKLTYLSLLLINVITLIGSIQSHPISRTTRLFFKSDKLVLVNGTRFSELNCIAQSSLTRELCSNILEIVCSVRNPGLTEIDSCEIIRSRTAICKAELSSSIFVTDFNCNDFQRLNCYLTFSFNSNADLIKILQSKSDDQFTKVDSAEDLKKTSESVRTIRILMIICISFVCLLAFVILCLPGLFFCFMWLKFTYCTDVADDEEDMSASH